MVDFIFKLYALILLARVLLSWVPLDPYNPIVQLVHRMTEPVLAPIRRAVPPVGMMDMSPLIAFILLLVLEQIVLTLLRSMVR